MRVVDAEAHVHENVSRKARVVQRLARILVQPAMGWPPVNERTLTAMRRFDRWHRYRRLSERVDRSPHRLGGVPAERMRHRDAPAEKTTILYLHGGAFVSGGIDSHRRVCEGLALATGATVYSLAYTQWPDGPVAVSVQDAIRAYADLLDRVDRPDQVVVAGDSAGGYLAMKVAELAVRRGLRPPAAALGLSPLLSLDPLREDPLVRRVIRARDAYIPARHVPAMRQLWAPPGAAIEGAESLLDATDVIVTPTFLVAAEDELLRPEAEAMAVGLRERGVDVELHLWRKQVHAFPVMADVLPEAQQALDLAATFVRRVLAVAERTSK